MHIILPISDQALEPSTYFDVVQRLQRMSDGEFFAFCQASPELKLERKADGTIEFQTITGGKTGERNSELNIEKGCRLAWLLDPKNETARLFRADGSVSVVKSFEETLSGEDVLRGFSFALSLLR